jgi:hypothetical protein
MITLLSEEVYTGLPDNLAGCRAVNRRAIGLQSGTLRPDFNRLRHIAHLQMHIGAGAITR